MKVEGSIFIDNEGIVFSKVKGDAQSAIRCFYDMLQEAKDCKDKFYYVYSKEWEEFWLNSQNVYDKYWQGAGQIASQLLFSYSNFVFQPIKIDNSGLFNKNPLPRTHGGFEYEGCPSSDYIYDKPSIDAWHDQWFINNLDKIDWTNTNGIMPRRERIIAILRNKLSDLKKNKDNQKSLSHQEIIQIKSLDVENIDSETVVNEFYELIVCHKSKSGDIISFAIDLAKEICDANYYHQENDLVKLENDYRNDGNNHQRIQNKINERQRNILNKKKEYKIYEISAIYSIIKDGKHQFLSVDTQHGMFELCDEKGNHVGEYRFDGSPNGNGTAEADHGLYCIEDWLKKMTKNKPLCQKTIVKTY